MQLISSDRNFLPKYVQIQDHLTGLIETNKLHPGDLVPSERELSDRFGVSRMTARHALTSLVTYGLLVRIQGKGTFVAAPKVEHDIGSLVSFTESSLRRGIKPSGRLLKFETVEAGESLAQTLKLNLGQPVYLLIRVRYGNNVPMVLEKCYFPCHRCPGIERFNLEQSSIYQIWRDEYGIAFGKMRQTLEPVAADELESESLHVPIGSPLMLVERISYDTEGQPVEFAKDVHRGDRTRFVSELMIGRERNF